MHETAGISDIKVPICHAPCWADNSSYGGHEIRANTRTSHWPLDLHITRHQLRKTAHLDPTTWKMVHVSRVQWLVLDSRSPYSLRTEWKDRKQQGQQNRQNQPLTLFILHNSIYFGTRTWAKLQSTETVVYERYPSSSEGSRRYSGKEA